VKAGVDDAPEKKVAAQINQTLLRRAQVEVDLKTSLELDESYCGGSKIYPGRLPAGCGNPFNGDDDQRDHDAKLSRADALVRAAGATERLSP